MSRNNRAHVFCGFGKDRWRYKYGTDLDNQSYNYGTHFAMPYQIPPGHDINADNFAVDGCSGFQKVLDGKLGFNRTQLSSDSCAGFTDS